MSRNLVFLSLALFFTVWAEGAKAQHGYGYRKTSKGARFNDGRFRVTTETKLCPLARFGRSMVARLISALSPTSAVEGREPLENQGPVDFSGTIRLVSLPGFTGRMISVGTPSASPSRRIRGRVPSPRSVSRWRR